MASSFLRLHSFLPFSRANGPGLRAVIWVQGCSLGCPGCFNPQTHPFTGGQLVSVDELFERIIALGDAIEGITLSGGEPLQQRQAVVSLLERVRRKTTLSVLIFTGYTWEEVQQMPEADALLTCVDVLIAGRYNKTQRLANDLRGSANKTVHFLTDRYSEEDLKAVPATEVQIDCDGQLVITGIDPPRFLKGGVGDGF